MTREEEIPWQIPDAFPLLLPGEIHVWCARLGTEDGAGAGLTACLGPDEIARARSFHFDVDRRHFAAARGNLRHLLARYAGRDPAALTFRYGPFGKPALLPEAGATGAPDFPGGLTFNQSHCGSLWLLAVASNQPVGIDVEQVRDLPDLALLEDRVFAADELPRQQAQLPAARRLAFFRRWTEREAVAKFHGTGFDPALPCAPAGRCEPLIPTADSVGTLAHAGAAQQIRQFQWSPALLSCAA